MHPAVEALLKEYPHPNYEDPGTSQDGAMIVYGIMRMRIGRYLKANFPTVPEHVLSAYSQINARDTYEILDSGFAAIIEQGPHSCMKDFDLDEHPYNAYDPEFGWRLAVRRQAGMVQGRALINDKRYVRTYSCQMSNELNQADPGLDAYLRSEGYSKCGSWRIGTRLRGYEASDGRLIFPYLDGGNEWVSEDYGDVYVIADRDSSVDQWQCDCSEGKPERVKAERPRCQCARCDCQCARCDCDIMEDDESYGTEDGEVCDDCISSYTWVDREDNYIHDNYVETVGGITFDTRNLPNEIVEVDGEYDHVDNCVCIDDDWYRMSDPDVVYLEDTEKYGLKEGAWQASDETWHSDNEEQVELDGELYTQEQAADIIHEKQLELELA